MTSTKCTPPTILDSTYVRTGPQIARAFDAGELRQVTLGMGCFWGPDSRFGSIDGVVQTRAGYAGGTAENPLYRNMPGHAEVTRVLFDPDKLHFDELFDLFRHWLTPEKAFGSKYRPVIFAASDEHNRRVRDWVFAMKDSSTWPQVALPGDVEARFWDAEPYHQKYRLKKANPDLASALEERFGADWDQTELATKLNGLDKEVLSDSRDPLIRALLGSPSDRLAST